MNTFSSNDLSGNTACLKLKLAELVTRRAVQSGNWQWVKRSKFCRGDAGFACDEKRVASVASFLGIKR